jgi:hypothetical protein
MQLGSGWKGLFNGRAASKWQVEDQRAVELTFAFFLQIIDRGDEDCPFFRVLLDEVTEKGVFRFKLVDDSRGCRWFNSWGFWPGGNISMMDLGRHASQGAR